MCYLRTSKSVSIPAAFTTLCLLIFHASSASGQDLLGDSIALSGATLNLRTYADIGALGGSNIISMTHSPADSSTLFTTVQTGSIYATQDSTNGAATVEWFNYNDALDQAFQNPNNGYALENSTSTHGGLRSVAFHPEFASNGKFYTSAMVDRPSNTSGFNYLGNSTSGFDAESVVVEWTYDHNTEAVDASSYRELFRVQMPVFDHPIKQIAFNNLAAPGDEDFGLLYITHGDGSVQSAISGGGQNRDDALGKVLRINPLQDGSSPYTTPNSPFVNDPTTLDEIYTLGHRNPHHISFAETPSGDTVPIVAEVGRDNVEEINLLQPGGDYGWSDREGTFVHNPNGGSNGDGYGLDYGVSSLPANDWQLNDYVYPAAQYDHDASLGAGFVGSAVAGGFAIQNNSDPALSNQYIFADFAFKSGHVYHADVDELTNAHTQLADGELPTALSQATISRLSLTLDEDGDGVFDSVADDINTLLGVTRSDLRFGQGAGGEMYVSSKSTGKVYLVENTLPGPEFGSLALEINADTGLVQIVNDNALAANLKGYSILSTQGLLSLADWDSLEENPQTPGWHSANSNAQALSELSPVGDLAIDEASPHLGTPVKITDGETFGTPASIDPIGFEYTLSSGEVFQGEVRLTGLSTENNLVLTVDPSSGQATLTNRSTTTVAIRGYTISSASGSLLPNSWSSLEDQLLPGVEEANPTAEALSELIALAGNAVVISPNESLDLGILFQSTGGMEDLALEFLLAGTGVDGDFNGDGVVDLADYTVWRDALGTADALANRGTENSGLVSISDYDTWRQNFGSEISASQNVVIQGIVNYSSDTLSSAASIPEPATAMLFPPCVAALWLRARRRPTSARGKAYSE